jgi:hypothetical protein
MSPHNNPADLLQRMLDAQLRYYAEIGRLTVECVESWGDLSRMTRFTAPGDDRFGRQDEPPGRFQQQAYAPPPPAATGATVRTAAAPPAAIVLEGASGSTVQSVFLVENGSAVPVSSPIAPSWFYAPDGAKIQPRLQFDPEVVTVEPGEHLLVQMTATITDDLQLGVTYRGTLGVPGLPGTELAIVVRRHAAEA